MIPFPKLPYILICILFLILGQSGSSKDSDRLPNVIHEALSGGATSSSELERGIFANNLPLGDKVKCVESWLLRKYTKYSESLCSNNKKRQVKAKDQYYKELIKSIVQSLEDNHCHSNVTECGKDPSQDCMCIPFKLSLDFAKYDKKAGGCKMDECARCWNDTDCYTGFQCQFTNPPILTKMNRFDRPVRLCQKSGSECQVWQPTEGKCGQSEVNRQPPPPPEMEKLGLQESKSSKGSSEIVSKGHQDKINKFAIRNAWADEIMDEINELKNDLKNIEDAQGDIMLLDDEDRVPISIAESFVEFKPADALTHIESEQKKKEVKIAKLEDRLRVVKEEMSTLKAELYTQFGDSINLEK